MKSEISTCTISPRRTKSIIACLFPLPSNRTLSYGSPLVSLCTLLCSTVCCSALSYPQNQFHLISAYTVWISVTQWRSSSFSVVLPLQAHNYCLPSSSLLASGFPKVCTIFISKNFWSNVFETRTLSSYSRVYTSLTKYPGWSPTSKGLQRRTLMPRCKTNIIEANFPYLDARQTLT